MGERLQPQHSAKSQFQKSHRCFSAPLKDNPGQTFQVSHPFHPLFGCRLQLVAHRKNWGQDRVFILDQDKHLISLPTEWTSVAPVDPFVFISAGRYKRRFKSEAEGG